MQEASGASFISMHPIPSVALQSLLFLWVCPVGTRVQRCTRSYLPAQAGGLLAHQQAG